MSKAPEQKPKTLSRQERMRRNPVPWIVLLIINVFAGLNYVFPKIMHPSQGWLFQQKKIEELAPKVEKLKEEKPLKIEEFRQVREIFEEKKKPFVIKEDQIFPEYIDIEHLVRTLEIYALQLPLVERNSVFVLNSISFSEPQRDSSKKEGASVINAYKTSANISFNCNEKNFREFIRYIQSTDKKLSKRFQKGFGNMSPLVVEYLQNNLLPIAQIESINTSKDKNNKDEMKVDMRISFFSQKGTPDKKR